MKPRRLFIGALAGVTVFALLASGRRSPVSMHELDWSDYGASAGRRRYRSPGHLLHHLWELTCLTIPIFEVYVLRALSPAFREQIMIVTAMADNCSA